MAPKKILVVLTSHGKLESNGKATGWYLPEFAHPFFCLHPDYEIVVASPNGGLAPISPDSVSAFSSDPESSSFLQHHSPLWHNTVPLATCHDRIHEFAAVFFPGGHGPVFDLRVDEHSIRLIKAFYQAGKPVAAVCHGPIVLANVEIDGEPLVRGKRVTGFTNDEEAAAGWDKDMPVLLETEMRVKGAKFEMADKMWAPHVVRDGNLLTGQNPASSKPIGEELLRMLQ